MPGTLHDFWSLTEPTLPYELVGREARRRLSDLCRLLPFQPFVLLECRLSEGEDQIDLSQMLAPARVGSPRLQTYLNASKKVTDQPQWTQTIAKWHTLSAETRALVKVIWLEYDVEERQDSQKPLQPALFFSADKLDGHITPDIGFSALLELAHVYLRTTQRDLIISAVADLKKVFPLNFSLGACGFMLSRDPATLRVNLTAPTFEELMNFIQSLNGQARSDELKSVLAMAEQSMKSPVLCLDLADGVSKRIGLELFMRDRDLAKPPRLLLNWLVEHKLCSETKRSALQDFHVAITPNQAKTAWPDELIVESILAAENKFSSIMGHVNHFKIVINKGRLQEAKAYLAFNHLLPKAGG